MDWLIDIEKEGKKIMKNYDKITIACEVKSICYNCDTHIEIESKFCNECGISVVKCERCMVLIPSSHKKFCPCCYSDKE